MSNVLELRVTHKYVGTHQHEDEWRYIGEFTVIRKDVWVLYEEDEFDPTEPMKAEYLLTVNAEGATVEDIKQALKDTFTAAGCHHEYDCCGCRSYYAGNPVEYGFGMWSLTVNSYRNY